MQSIKLLISNISKLVLNYGFVLNASAICFLSLFVLNNKNSNANTGSSINLEPPPNLSLLFNQFNDLSSHSINKNPENMMTNCKYYPGKKSWV